MWSGIWGKAAQKAFTLYLWGHYISSYNLHTSSYSMDLYGKTPYPDPTRSTDFTRSWKVFNPLNTSFIPLCYSSTIGSLLTVSVFDSSFACKLSCNSGISCTGLFGAFVFKFNMGSDGAAYAIGLSYWFNAIFLGLYAMYSPKCADTRAPISMEVFSTIKDFFRFGIPSALMVW